MTTVAKKPFTVPFLAIRQPPFTSPPPISKPGEVIIYYENTIDKLMFSRDTGPFEPLKADDVDLYLNGTLFQEAVTGLDLTGPFDLTDLGDKKIAISINEFSDSTAGIVPASTGNPNHYLRADGTWEAPPGTGTIADGDYGDIEIAGSVWLVQAGAIDNTKLADVQPATFKGRASAGIGPVEDITPEEATSILTIFTDTLQGVVPASGGGSTNFLRADGTWANPPSDALTDGTYGDIQISGSGTVLSIINGAVDTAALGGDITSTAKDFLKESTPSEMRTFLELGSAAQEDVTAFEAFGSIATHNSASGAHGISTFASTLLDDTSATEMKTTLGLATVASTGSASDLTSGTLAATRLPGLTGEVTAPIGSNVTTILNNIVSNEKLSLVDSGIIKGRIAAGTGNVQNLTGTQVTSLLDIFSNSLKGLVPASGGGTANFLRADGYWSPFSLADGNYGEINVAGNNWTIRDGYVTNAKMTNVATGIVKGRNSAGTGQVEDLNMTTLTSMLNLFSNSLKGLVPASGGGTANFLRADGTWSPPISGVVDDDYGDITVSGSGTDWQINLQAVENPQLKHVASQTFKGRVASGAGEVQDLTAAQATSILEIFTDVLKGLVPASGGGTANYLRADGVWAAPPGGISSPIMDTSVDVSLGANDHTVWVNTNSGDVTITLPNAITNSGKLFAIKKMDNSANQVIISTTETIDGQSGYTIAEPYECITVQSNGNFWGII